MGYEFDDAISSEEEKEESTGVTEDESDKNEGEPEEE